MGKKGSWFSAIKRVFLPHSKDKLANEPDKKSSSKEKKKKGIGKFRQGESSSSFIPLFREPSSIEKILDEAEREHKLTFRPLTPPAEQPRTPTFVPPPSRLVSSSPRVPSLRVNSSPRAATSPRAPSPRAAASPRPPSPRAAASPRPPSPKAAGPSTSARATSPKNVERERQVYRRIEPTLRNQNACATKIQAAYRGYVARRSFRALKGLVRLQGVIRGQNVKRQTMNAMKCMQLLVRVQSQIQSRRIQMLENQARQHKNNDKEVESHLGKWSQASEAGNGDDWDDSVLTKDQVEARIRSKMDAVIKRERAMAYAYSHQLWKASPRATQLSLTDIRSNGFPWWWNWLERQLPASSSNNNQESQPTKSFHPTPTRPSSEVKPSPVHQQHFTYDSMDTPTPRSTRSNARFVRTPVHKMTPNNNAANSSSGLSKYSRARGGGGGDHSSPSPFNFPSKDDDSLTSCPPFSRPNYMTPTVSAKAKARANSNPRERFPLPGTPSSEKRRVSFPFGGGQSFKWNAGSLFSSNSNNKGSGSPRVIEKHQPIHSIGNLSVDSTVSMPAAVGRRPFNRFV
ncbi:unnamed protein product [Linum trigynum]|uniref:DUF4005 domain-containing protein n=1 Tax=Linum trigynum TaxID=586398 RepID=A0AAV2G4B0_9ROSI